MLTAWLCLRIRPDETPGGLSSHTGATDFWESKSGIESMMDGHQAERLPHCLTWPARSHSWGWISTPNGSRFR